VISRNTPSAASVCTSWSSSIPGSSPSRNFETPDGEEVSLELFENDESVQAWRGNPEHREVQRWAREEFYSWYSVQASEVIRAYEVDLMAPKAATA